MSPFAFSDQLLRTFDKSSEPQFAVAPLCRWLRRKPSAGQSRLDGRAAACRYVERWGQPDEETIFALEYAESLADPEVKIAAQSALLAVKGR